jgi:polysaccharide export outer membrane protein
MKTHTGMLAVLLACASAADITSPADPSTYRVGPGDQVSVHLRDLKEIEIKPARIGQDGVLQLPYAGTIRAQGLTTAELAREIESKLSEIVREPKVTVEVTEYGSQPVSVLGAVNKPGIHQLRGRKNLVDVLSLAEGIKNEAGGSIKITRPKSSGLLPIANRREDAAGQFTTAEVSTKALLEKGSPEANIEILAHDVINVPRAELVYVLGSVRKTGGFVLAERESMTVLQAIALAEGVQPVSSPQNARIIRSPEPGAPPVETPIDVKKILANKAPDQPLLPNDILFIPSSAAKSVGLRTLEAGVQMATGIVIWRR